MGEYSREYLASRVAGMSKVAASARRRHPCHTHAMGKTAKSNSPPVDYTPLAEGLQKFPQALLDAGKSLFSGVQATPQASLDAGKSLSSGVQATPQASWDAGKSLSSGVQATPQASWDAGKSLSSSVQATHQALGDAKKALGEGLRATPQTLGDAKKALGEGLRATPQALRDAGNALSSGVQATPQAFRSVGEAGYNFLFGEPPDARTDYTAYPWNKTLLLGLGAAALVPSLLGGGGGGGYPGGGYPGGGYPGGGASAVADKDKVKAGAFTSRLEAAVANQGYGGPMRVVNDATQNQNSGNPWVA